MSIGTDATTELAIAVEGAELEAQRAGFERARKVDQCDRCLGSLDAGAWTSFVDSENAIAQDWTLCRSCSRLMQRFLMSGRADNRLGDTKPHEPTLETS